MVVPTILQISRERCCHCTQFPKSYNYCTKKNTGEFGSSRPHTKGGVLGFHERHKFNYVLPPKESLAKVSMSFFFHGQRSLATIAWRPNCTMLMVTVYQSSYLGGNCRSLAPWSGIYHKASVFIVIQSIRRVLCFC